MKRKKWVIVVVSFSLLLCGLWLWTQDTERDYQAAGVVCNQNSFISWEERLEEPLEGTLMVLQAGDILVTPCSHTFGWRNGHAAIVVDAAEGITLESVVLGTPSKEQRVQKWRKYPGVAVLRLKGADQQERSAIAAYARTGKVGIPYGFWEEILEHIGGRRGRDTHCAHLIWETYLAFGYNIDGDGGIIVTPRDLYESPLLEVVEEYGMNGW